jgi:hypothetical protein
MGTGEVPLNQHDLAITLGVFCYINLRSLRRMSVYLTDEDIETYTHMWRYAGYVLGINDALLPQRIEDQEEFMLASMLHSGDPDFIPGDAAKEFINAFAQKAADDTRGWLPFDATQTFLFQMIVYLNGNDYVKGMEIEDLGQSALPSQDGLGIRKCV